MPLAMAPPGSRVKIERILAGRALNQRLAEMGLIPGSVLTVQEGTRMGPLMVKVGESRLVLGQGMGMKIMVTPV